MAHLPEPVQNLITALERLPGIGPKSASRLAFYLLSAQDDLCTQLANSLISIKSATGLCKICYNITLSDRETCEICSIPERNTGSICVVEEPLDVLAIERTGGFSGRYHVLHGVLSPIEGIGPDDINIRPLIQRVMNENIREVIIATNPSMEGDATALYIKQQLGPNIRITRLARGLPVGGDLEYADQNTLLRALAGRQEID
ncbi:MAG: recombination mediator RecR [Chloroflexi bacterium]|nr:recombination mediator RecR [Chloroflexota bacterium]